MHFIPWIVTTSSWKISRDFNYAYRLHLLNRPSSCTLLGWLAKMFQKILSTSHMACNTILWNFFLLKKSPIASVIFLFRRFAKRMWVPSIAPHMLGILVRFSKWTMTSFKSTLEGILMYLLNNLSLSISTSQIMSTYFLIVDAPTLNRSVVCVALNPWANR